MLTLPKVLLVGLRKSGKSSIQSVVFQKLEPHETVELTTTTTSQKATFPANEFLNFEVWDLPGQSNPFDSQLHSPEELEQQLLQHCGVIVFVLDCREQVDVACGRLVDTVCVAARYDPKLWVEVFIHKVDALSEDHQTDLLTFLQRKVEEEARQRIGTTLPLCLSFNLTSIYDHSVFQAFSLVVQRLIQNKVPKINELLQLVNSNCGSDISYLFLSRSKIFLAVEESKRMKWRSYDLCSDAMEVLVKMDGIYGQGASDKASGASEFIGGASEDGVSEEKPRRKMAQAITHLNGNSCIYVRELPNSLTIVLMLKQSDLCNKVLIDRNIDICYSRTYKIFCS